MKKVSLILLVLLLLVPMAVFPAAAESAAIDCVYLSDLTAKDVFPINWVASNATFDERPLLVCGYPLEKGVSMHPTQAEKEAYIEYDISAYSYDTFAAVVGKQDQTKGKKVTMIVYVDGVEKYNSGDVSNGFLEYCTVDVKGAKSIKLYITDGGDGYASDMASWGYPCLFNKADLKIASIELIGVSHYAMLGQEMDYSYGKLLVTYNTGAFEEVALDVVEITGYNKNTAGVQALTVSYGGVSAEHRVLVNDTLAYVADLEWIESSMFAGYNGGKASKDGMDIDGLPLAIAGKVCCKSIFTCPLNVKDAEDSAAGITVDLSGKGYTRFCAHVGKTRQAFAKSAKAIYSVYGDGRLLAQSPEVYCGEDTWFDVDITGVSRLQLVVTHGGDGVNADWTAWDDAVVYAEAKAGETTAAPVTTAAPETTTVQHPVTEAPVSTPDTTDHRQAVMLTAAGLAAALAVLAVAKAKKKN